MIRTVITPKNTDLHLSIPKDYIGKQVEVLLYTTDEVKEEKTAANAAALRGKLHLSNDQYKDFHQYLNDTRNEWNRDI
jgi:hypothetical protein